MPEAAPVMMATGWVGDWDIVVVVGGRNGREEAFWRGKFCILELGDQRRRERHGCGKR